MSRGKEYQRLLNSQRWKDLRISYLRAHPLCERCWANGQMVSAAVDIHHKTPVESVGTLREMERLCFDWNNLQALCIPCHSTTHKEMGKGTRELHKQRVAERLRLWVERHTRKP